MSSRLTRGEYDDIKQMINSQMFQLITISKTKKRSYTVVRQVNNSRNWNDYRERYWSGYEAPQTLIDKIKEKLHV